MLKEAIIKNEEITIRFQAKSANDFHSILEAVKTIPNRSFVSTEKVWKCPKSNIALNILKEQGFFINGQEEHFKILDKKIPEIIQPITPKGLKGKLWEFQKTGVGFVESRNGRAIIADEMRLGKSIQALGWLQLRPDEGPILIICDASAKLVWSQMIKDWLPSNNKTQILQGRTSNIISKDTKFIIVNYESLYILFICDICEGRKIVFGRKCLKCKGKGKIAQLREDINNFTFFAMIVDEAQKMRNINSYHTKIILELGKKINHVIATTGTPIENRP